MKRAVVAAWAGAGNVGDELILRSLLQELRRLGVAPVVLSLDPESTSRTHGVEATSNRGLWAALDTSDAMIFGGGGLVQDRSSLWSPWFQLARPWLAGRRRRPLSALGLGAEPARSPTTSWIVRHGLRQVSEIVARDERSARVLRSFGLSRVSVGADLAWLLPAPAAPPQRPATVVVSLAPPSGAARMIPARFKAEPERALERVAAVVAPQLDRLARVAGLHVRFVSMDHRRDGRLHDAVKGRLTVDSTTVEPDAMTALEEFSGAQLVIAARYHACVGALLSRRPLVALSYATKVSDLVRGMSEGVRLLPYSRRGIDDLAEGALGLLDAPGGSLPSLSQPFAERAQVNRDSLERFILSL